MSSSLTTMIFETRYSLVAITSHRTKLTAMYEGARPSTREDQLSLMLGVQSSKKALLFIYWFVQMLLVSGLRLYSDLMRPYI